jgi:hypothetical protein
MTARLAMKIPPPPKQACRIRSPRAAFLYQKTITYQGENYKRFYGKLFKN